MHVSLVPISCLAHCHILNVPNCPGSKGKRKRQRVGGGTKGSNGAGVLSGDDALQSQPDSASKTPWTPRYLSDLKSSNIYNRIATEAPAEVPNTVVA